ncbi:MAG TPA: YciI family protein [Candidatus Nitrosotalea sp.]|nr:YciI family protein [Candidatus Nitrosotalea sp.]
MKLLSIVTLDRTGGHPHDDPSIPERMGQLIAEMRAKGALVDTGGRDDEMLELSVARKNGRTTVTDGPFAESKEVVGGFALLDVKDRADAIAWTNRFLEILGDAKCYLHEVSPTP